MLATKLVRLRLLTNRSAILWKGPVAVNCLLTLIDRLAKQQAVGSPCIEKERRFGIIEGGSFRDASLGIVCRQLLLKKRLDNTIMIE